MFQPMKGSFLILSLLVCGACNSNVQDGQCNQDAGNLDIANGNYKAAFSQLRYCESVDGATALTLGQLAVLYGYFGYGEFEYEADRSKRTYALYTRSALKGNEDAISTLVSMLENGEPVISLKPQKEKVACLETVLETAVPDDERASLVSACLK